jgi:hypothetical protein
MLLTREERPRGKDRKKGEAVGATTLWRSQNIHPHHDWTVILIQEKYQNYRLFCIKTTKSRALKGKYRQNPVF